MPVAEIAADGRPVVFFLHFLGGSARSWDQVAAGLDAVADCRPLDLPGFGDAADVPGYSVTAMVDHVAAAVRHAAPRRWFVVGHSMGAKVATLLARRMEDGAPGLDGLVGLVLVAGSPPSPEPMAEFRRQAMLDWFAGDAAASRTQADGFIKQASGNALHPDTHADAVGAVLQSNRDAWQAWLRRGSHEDLSDQVGLLETYALVVAGADDADLGPDAQQTLMMRHFSQGHLVTIPDAGHLLPLEVSDKVAQLIAGFIGAAMAVPAISPAYRALIESDRVSARTRDLLLRRLQPDPLAYRPGAVGAGQMPGLRALVNRVVPQTGAAIDLAVRIDTQLQAGVGDGWRVASLPPDVEAYRAGLRTLDAAAGGCFASLAAARQDALLQQAAAGKLSATGPDLLDAGQMKYWFIDVCSDAARAYVAHPATLSRMGYSGIGYGGDGEPKPGFHLVGPGEREAWEPQAETTP